MFHLDRNSTHGLYQGLERLQLRSGYVQSHGRLILGHLLFTPSICSNNTV
jgi:hypothetical protein